MRNVRPDAQLMAKLTEAYSGEASELTTSLLYSYQNVKCSNKYAKIAEPIRGVFYVETLHLEMLGNTIIKLGGGSSIYSQIARKIDLLAILICALRKFSRSNAVIKCPKRKKHCRIFMKKRQNQLINRRSQIYWLG